MKKKRLLYLDFIRAFAMIVIILTHYNAWYLMYTLPPRPEMCIITSSVGNVYIGSFGVSLFLIISGAALMYVYDESCDLKMFYRRRLLSIYPLFWLTFVIGFLVLFLLNHGVTSEAKNWTMILSVLGLDSLLSPIIPNFAIIGEWFVGFILFFYIIFPLLRKLIKEHPVLLWCIAGICYVGTFFVPEISLTKAVFLTMRLPELLFGMTFVKYIKKVNWQMALISLLIILANTFFKPTISVDLQTTYIGITSFIVLVYVSKWIMIKPVEMICRSLSKYSYAVFLCHHFIINLIMQNYDRQTIGHRDNLILFTATCAVIALVSFILYHLNDHIIAYAKAVFSSDNK